MTRASELLNIKTELFSAISDKKLMAYPFCYNIQKINAYIIRCVLSYFVTSSLKSEPIQAPKTVK